MPFKKGITPPGAKPFKKGNSGNPNGRPCKIPELDKLLAEVLGEEKEGVAAAKAILMALRAKATKGDVRAAEVLLDRAYGKAKNQVDITTDGEKLQSTPNLSDSQFNKLISVIDEKSNPG